MLQPPVNHFAAVAEGLDGPAGEVSGGFEPDDQLVVRGRRKIDNPGGLTCGDMAGGGMATMGSRGRRTALLTGTMSRRRR